MLRITRFHFDTKVQVSPSPLNQHDKDNLSFAGETLAFLLPHTGTFTGQEWIDAIKQHFDLTVEGDPRVKAVLATLEHYAAPTPDPNPNIYGVWALFGDRWGNLKYTYNKDDALTYARSLKKAGRHATVEVYPTHDPQCPGKTIWDSERDE